MDNTTYKLKDLKLHSAENPKGHYTSYYLSAVYEVEDDKQIKELTIPHLALPIFRVPIIRQEYDITDVSLCADLGFGVLDVMQDVVDGVSEPVYYVEKLIKEKTQEMTLEEIEKILGHKVKIISNEK